MSLQRELEGMGVNRNSNAGLMRPPNYGSGMHGAPMMSFQRGMNGRIRLRRMFEQDYDQRVRTLMLE